MRDCIVATENGYDYDFSKYPETKTDILPSVGFTIFYARLYYTLREEGSTHLLAKKEVISRYMKSEEDKIKNARYFELVRASEITGDWRWASQF